ncbi:TMV resistance protein N-like isoform X3 [Lycium barbarum]|uniref:TMV resistance protein N-like isoform X3 n=1 Tax=Lycium barbarum TaxID=112863 RepID=UPI00293E8038|nr:TMV resistance protein N-like isoform X3 [Lycium barbarum]
MGNQREYTDLEVVARWIDALRKASNITGWHVSITSNRDQVIFINLIVNAIIHSFPFTQHQVGIKSRVKELTSLLSVELGGVYFVGIWGMCGSGKTTVARAIFDEMSDQFEGSCFLGNVRKISKKDGVEAPEHLQKKLLSQILKQQSPNIASANEGAKMISSTLRFKKVLIVLDDVDNDNQLEYLVGKRDWFGDGSRIITTSRNIDLLQNHNELYHVPELDFDDALELFSWHAFQQETPDPEFENLSIWVVIYANGLPLALEVLGSFLYKGGMNEWRSALDRLKDIGEGEIIKQLSLSLDGLSYKNKDIFLRIACFFRGKQINDVITILNSCGFKSEIGIDILVRKSLLYISDGMVEMHDLIQQMGQQVVRDTDQDQSWEHSRLWHDKDIETVFSENLISMEANEESCEIGSSISRKRAKRSTSVVWNTFLKLPRTSESERLKAQCQIPRSHTFPMVSHKELVQKWKYDAFLSFRGEDTRSNFVAHLYKRMEDIGIYTFKDDVKLERGKFISPELLKAIEESKFAIIIFSENYASSTWCLQELTKIMECVEKNGQEAIPIFYNVDPSDVRMQRNSFAVAMAEHEADLKGSDMEKVQRWKDVLHKAANIAGWDVRKTANGDEAKCIDLIVNKIFCSVEETISSFAKHLVGIKSRVKEVKSLLNVEFGGVYYVGIWGMGGVGKTTVARAIFDEISYLFEGSCFLANVREISKKYGPEGPEHLQKKLLSQILKQQSPNISSANEGVKMMSRMLRFKKVLIVLDDVDNNDQLEYLVGKCDWFGDGSRIITTSRNNELLRKHDKLYRVPELAIHEALELFSWHAFQQGTPDKEFANLCISVVNYANGLPLALEVLGSFLYRRGMNEWKSALDRLEDIGDGKIVKQLSLSLDGLSPEDKDIFLDIACFFRGKKKDDVITILNSFGFKSEIGIDILIRKSVLYISEGMVEMHDLIEQMGQQVARNIDQDQPWKHSRLWHGKDIETVFSENLWTDSVKGITVPIGSDQHICKWSKAFRNMPCLRLLIVKGEEVRHYEPVSNTIEYLPSSLKWLDWSYYSFESLPANFQPRNLVGLNMTFSSLIEFCKEPKAFNKLTILNLSFSENLIRTPCFSETPNLKRIILKSCLSLVEVHPSIGNLKKLIFLNMENCKNLKILLSSIQMESLESLNLSGCEKLGEFPEIRGNMELLSELLLGRTTIWELPSSIGRLIGISLLDLRSCKNLVRLPASITEMKKLKILILKGCLKLAAFPENLGDLEELEELYAGNTAIWKLPDSVGELSRLKVLSLRRGRKVKCRYSRNLKFPISLNCLLGLKSLDLSGCNTSGEQICPLRYLTSLLELNLSRSKLTSLPSIADFPRLRYLNITHCQELKELPKLPPSIKELYAEDFLGIQSIVALWSCPLLYLVSFTNYSFEQQPYTEKSTDSSVLDQILISFLSDAKVNVVNPPNYDRKGISIVFPGCAIPTWFEHQTVKEKILVELPEDWFDYNFQGFAICCVTSMGAGVHDPSSGLSGKYDSTFINAKLMCSNNPEKLKVLEKECKVGTASRTPGCCVCFAYLPLYFLLQASGADARNLNQYGLFEASINNRIATQWGVHLIYKIDRQFFRSRIDEALLGPNIR